MSVQEAIAREVQGKGIESSKPPPLETGDRLTLPEFERRYEAMPHVKKAELIEGVVYMPSPVRANHGRAHSQVISWLSVYWAATPGVDLNDNTTIRLDADNEVQPDALLRLEPVAAGRSRISDDDYVEGPPELIVEIATSSAAYDLHDKKKVYRRNGVQEYLVWQVYEKRLDWFRLHRGEYVPLLPGADGIIETLMKTIGLKFTRDKTNIFHIKQKFHDKKRLEEWVSVFLKSGLDSESFDIEMRLHNEQYWVSFSRRSGREDSVYATISDGEGAVNDYFRNLRSVFDFEMPTCFYYDWVYSKSQKEPKKYFEFE